MRIVFWQNTVSPHLSALVRALGGLGHHVTYVSAEVLTQERKALGWSVPDLGTAEVRVAPGENAIRDLIQSDIQETVHVLGGARVLPLGKSATWHASQVGARVGIMSEGRNVHGLRGRLRLAKYSWERLRVGRHYQFILAMGQLGESWFRRCGYPPHGIFPFAYVVESRAEADARPATDDARAEYRIIYVGRPSRAKGVDVLLMSLAKLGPLRWKLVLVGDGPEALSLRSLACRLGIADRLEWRGALTNFNAVLEIGRSDLLVLPSHSDGWGAVVSESLMAGVPALCSDRCGAMTLLADDWRGEVFADGAVDDLARILVRRIAAGRITREQRQRIQAWSRCVSGESVAHYFLRVLDHVYRGGPRPLPPWHPAAVARAMPCEHN